MKEIIYNVIRAGLRHENYTYITERTKAWRAIVSGKGINDYMQQFHRRETKEMFEQRKELTKQITSAVCKNVRDIEYKVPRSNSIQRVVTVKDEKGKTALDQILKDFWGDSTFNDWMDLRWIELNDSDPNAFVVVEWKPFKKDEYAAPYPFEVSSEQAVMYEYDNQKLQYLIALTGDDYTGYFKDFTIKLEKVSQEVADRINLKDDEEIQGQDAEGNAVLYVKLKDVIYKVIEPIPHNLGYVPAFQPGYVRDLATNGHSFLPPWWAAESVLMNLIKSKSELDLTIALHVFPQKIEYSPRCGHTGCNGGYLPDGKMCNHCKGSGFETTHTSAQDIIRVTMPKDKDDMLPLEGFIHYVYPPIDLVKFMDEYVDKLSQRAMQFVFNSEIYSREAVAETATGKNIDMQAVYDTLYPMAKAMSRDWEFMIKCIGDITTIQVSASFTFSKDFKLKSLDGYYADLQTLSGVSGFVKSNIEDDIARITYADNPLELEKYFTKKAFFPFPGETPESIALKMTQNYVPEFYKTLYSCYGWVFDEIERTEGVGYYKLNRVKQWEILKAKIDEMIPEETVPVFTPIPKEEPILEPANNE